MTIPNGVWPFIAMLVEIGAEFEHCNRRIIVGKGRYFKAIDYEDLETCSKPGHLARQVWAKVLADWTHQQKEQEENERQKVRPEGAAQRHTYQRLG